MTIVVTGATGLIGQYLLPALANATSHRLVALSRRPPGATQMRVEWVTSDLTKGEDLQRVLPSAADVVIHLAQSAHYREFPDRALDIFDVNVASTARLLDWSRRAGVQHFLLASSGGVGTTGLRGSYYLASKASAELLIESYAGLLQTLVLRFFFVYGPGQKPWMLVPRLIDCVRTGKPIELAGANGARLNPTHVSDAVGAIAFAVESRAEGCIDIAGPDVLSIREIAETIGARLERSPVFGSKRGAAIDVIGDIREMTDRLGAPRRRFAEGVREMIQAGGVA